MRVAVCLVVFASVQSPLGDPQAAIRDLQAAVSSPESAIRHPRAATHHAESAIQRVCIDLIAWDGRGRLLDNLVAADFELEDDGVRQAVEEVRFVRTSPNETRLVGIFLDEYHVSRVATERVRDAVTGFVDQRLRPNDLLVVMRPLDSIFAIRVTTDRQAARAVVQSFEGRKGEYEARNAYERNFIAGTPARIESSRTQIALSALNALAVRLAGFSDQRKALIVITEGFGRVERYRGLEYLPTLETVIRSADQANVAIYPLSPSSFASDDPSVETLRTLALETAGEAIAGDLEAGLRRALDDSSRYYLLTYRTARPEDGRFHAVRVRVTRPGAQVRARKGYFARSPDEALRTALLARANEPATVKPAEPPPHVSTLIRTWFGMSRGVDGRTRVTFVWEPAWRVTGERTRRAPSRLVLTALAPDDAVVFEGVIMPTGPVALDASGAPVAQAVFDAPPGRLRLRMSIQDAARQVLDSDIRSITVRDMRGGIAIATPEVLRARNAREFRALDGEGGVPVASREFSRTERLLVRFHAYGPDGAEPRITARLRSRLGGVMRELSVTAPTTSGGASEIDLPLAGLAAGDYLIEVAATSPAGDARDVIDFRVTT